MVHDCNLSSEHNQNAAIHSKQLKAQQMAAVRHYSSIHRHTQTRIGYNRCMASAKAAIFPNKIYLFTHLLSVFVLNHIGKERPEEIDWLSGSADDMIVMC